MIKKTIKYTDYNGVEREEDFWFNLSKAELTKLETSENGGYSNILANIMKTKDVPEIIKNVEEIIRLSYGVKSNDGKYFRKTDEAWLDFKSTEAFDNLFMEIISSPDSAIAFVNGILPEELRREIANRQESDQKKLENVEA